MDNNRNNIQFPSKNKNENEKRQMNKNLINQSNKKQDDYFKTSNSNNHSQFEVGQEFEIEEDMLETQNQTKDVQQFNTQNYYNRQHSVQNRVVPKDQQFYKNKKNDLD